MNWRTPTELIPLDQALQGAFLCLLLLMIDTLKLFLTLELGISLLFLQEDVWDFFALFPYTHIQGKRTHFRQQESYQYKYSFSCWPYIEMTNICYSLYIDIQHHSVIKWGIGNHSLDHWPVYMLVSETVRINCSFRGLCCLLLGTLSWPANMEVYCWVSSQYQYTVSHFWSCKCSHMLQK